eukprot:8149322-Pyramimonas_sp.AAC.1
MHGGHLRWAGRPRGWLERFEDLQGVQAPWRRVNPDSASRVQVVRHRASCYLLSSAQQRKRLAVERIVSLALRLARRASSVRKLKMQRLHVNTQMLATTCVQLAQLISFRNHLLSLRILTTAQDHHSMGGLGPLCKDHVCRPAWAPG